MLENKIYKMENSVSVKEYDYQPALKFLEKLDNNTLGLICLTLQKKDYKSKENELINGIPMVEWISLVEKEVAKRNIDLSKIEK